MASTGLINTRYSAHNFSVKFSPYMCSYIRCPGWRNGWHMWYLAISGEDLATYAFWNLAYSRYICHDNLVNQECVAHSGSPKDDESSHYVVNQFFPHRNSFVVSEYLFACKYPIFDASHRKTNLISYQGFKSWPKGVYCIDYVSRNCRKPLKLFAGLQ